MAEEISDFGLYLIKRKARSAIEKRDGEEPQSMICGYGERGDGVDPLGPYLKCDYQYYLVNPDILDSSQNKMPKEISVGIEQVVKMQGIDDRIENGESVNLDEYVQATENLDKLAGCKFIYNENGDFEIEGQRINEKIEER